MPMHCAVIEGHSWPQAGDPTNRINGWRTYFNPLATIDIVNAWQPTTKHYQLFLIADELGWSHLPSYIPYQNRIALIKESPNLVGEADHHELARNFPLVLTHLKKQADQGPPFQLLPYSSNHLGFESSKSSNQTPPIKSKDRLCSFIGNLNHNHELPGYRLRQDVFLALSGDERIDCFGRDTRPIEFKEEGLRRYAFSIAMENSREDFYFTEKLIDCILMGTVPIYWGCPSIARYFDPRGILSFSSLNELGQILDSLSWQLYKSLQSYIVENFHRIIHEEMADFNGYLHRAVNQALIATGTNQTLENYRLSYKWPGKAQAAWRRHFGA